MSKRTVTVYVNAEPFSVAIAGPNATFSDLRQQLAQRLVLKEEQITFDLPSSTTPKSDLVSSSSSSTATLAGDEGNKGEKDELPLACDTFTASAPIKFVHIAQFPHLNHRVLLGKVGLFIRNTRLAMMELRKSPGITRVSKPIPGQHQIVQADSELFQHLTDDDNFTRNIGPESKVMRTLQEALDQGMLTASTESQSRAVARALFNPVFSKQAIEGYDQIMCGSIEEMLVYFDRHASEGTSFEISRTFRRFTTQTVERVVLGQGPQRFRAPVGKDGVPFSDFNSKLHYLILTTPIRAFFPTCLRRLTDEKWKRTIKSLHQQVDGIIKGRRAGIIPPPAKKDMLQHCLDSCLSDGTRLTDEEIRNNLLTLITAGTDTTAVTMTTCVHQLAINPDVMQKCVEEIRRAGIAVNSTRPTSEQLQKLEYLDWVILESLRMLPPAPGVGRKALRKCAVPSGDLQDNERLLFHEGDWAFTNLMTMSHHERYFGEDSFTFRPERWAPEEAKTRHPYSNAFFSSGSRSCIGRIFAMKELKLLMSVLISRYEIEAVTIDPKITVDILWRQKDLFVRLHHRQTDFHRSDPTLAIDIRDSITNNPTANFQVSVEQQAEIAKRMPEKVVVAFATGMGESSAMAKELYEMWIGIGLSEKQVHISTLDDMNIEGQDEILLNVVTSTYNGEAPPGAQLFARSSMVSQTRQCNVKYAIFGCGNREWRNTYQKFPKQLHGWIAARKGAIPLLEVGEGDVEDDQTLTWRKWRAEMLRSVIKQYQLPINNTFESVDGLFDFILTQSSLNVTLKDWNENVDQECNSSEANCRLVLANELQDRSKSGRTTLDVWIRVPASGFDYKEGDHLLVHPRNSDEIINRILMCLRMDRSKAKTKICSFSGHPRCRTAGNSIMEQHGLGNNLSIEGILRYHVDVLSAPSHDFLVQTASVARNAGNRMLCKQLEDQNEARKMKGFTATTTVVGRTMLEILEKLPALQLSELLNICPNPQPRRYSVASSPHDVSSKEKGLIRLLVSVVSDDGYIGQVSGYVFGENQERANMPVRCSIDPASFGNRVAKGAWEKPIVMIATGTGLAPFMSFLSRRRSDQMKGKVSAPAHLVFGSRGPYDQLCLPELQEYLEDGTLTQLHIAQSRIGDGPKYVSDVLTKSAPLFAALWLQGAVFYTCGPASAVKEALNGVAISCEELKDQNAQSLFDEGRLIEDVWG